VERGNSAYLLVTFLVYKFDFDHFYILAAYLRVLLNIISLLIFIICRKNSFCGYIVLAQSTKSIFIVQLIIGL